MTSRRHHFLAMVSALAAASAAHASLTTTQAYNDLWEFDQAVGNYNLVTYGNASMNNFGDVEGGLEIGGNLTIGGAAIATKLTSAAVKNSTTTPTLYVKGGLTDSSSSSIKLNNGYAALPSLTSTNYTWNSTTDLLKKKSNGATVLSEVNSSSPTADVNPMTENPNVNFTTLESHMNDVSNSLKSGTTTGTIKIVGGNLEFVAPVNSSGVVFFDLNMNLLSGHKYNGVNFSNVEIDVPTNIDFVVNVENANGRTLFGEGSGINFNAGTGDSRLLWNIESTSSMSAAHPGTFTIGNGGAFYGSVLAADYNVFDESNTFINGQVYADSFSGSTYGSSGCDAGSGTEMHFLGFDSDLPPAPEPSTYGLAGAALLGGLVALRRRARR